MFYLLSIGCAASLMFVRVSAAYVGAQFKAPKKVAFMNNVPLAYREETILQK